VLAPPNEIARNVGTVVAFLRGDPNALSQVDDSPDGVWRSFTGPIVAYPMFLLLLLTADMPPGSPYSFEGYLARETVMFALGVFLYPTLMLFGCLFLDREDQWGRYIALYNWSAPIHLGILLLVRVMTAGGMLPGPMTGLAEIMAIGVTLWIVYKIAHDALEIDGIQTVAVVLGYIAIGIGLNLL